jgi:hypothetical protein
VKRYTFQITPELDAGLKALKARDGVGEGEAIRRAIGAYLTQRGINVTGGKGKQSKGRKRP